MKHTEKRIDLGEGADALKRDGLWPSIARISGDIGNAFRRVLHISSNDKIMVDSFDMNVGGVGRVFYKRQRRELSLVRFEGDVVTDEWSTQINPNFRITHSKDGNYLAILENDGEKRLCIVVDTANGAIYRKFYIEGNDTRHIHMPTGEFFEHYVKKGDAHRRETYSVETGRKVEDVERVKE